VCLTLKGKYGKDKGKPGKVEKRERKAVKERETNGKERGKGEEEEKGGKKGREGEGNTFWVICFLRKNFLQKICSCTQKSFSFWETSPHRPLYRGFAPGPTGGLSSPDPLTSRPS